MAYAALLSLSQTLDQILIRDEYPHLFEKEKLVSLGKNVSALQTFLEEYWHKCRGAENPLESRIIDAARQAEYIIEDIIQYQFSSHLFSKFCIGSILKFCILVCFIGPEINFVSFHKVSKEIDFILKEAMKINYNNPAENVLSLHFSDSASLSAGTSSDINTTVFEDDFVVIKKRIYNRYLNFEVIPIVGMGGIGKSTLVRKLYEDSSKVGNFDRYIWIVVSQGYSQKKVFLEILVSMGMPIGKIEKLSVGELQLNIYQELIGRKYLVVVDDLWSGKPWDDLNLIFPKDTAGSRVLVTTRLSDIAIYVGSSSNPPHEVQLLNEYQSWMLFEERVFGKGFSCLSELEQIGKNVAKSCQGLPLTIVVIAGLLKGNTGEEYWKSISENMGSSEPNIALQCSKVLSLSYNHLPLYLRPCFLYVAAFPEDYEIKVAKLIRLWMAEGFVKPSGSKLLEDVAEGYLHDLVGRSLLMVSKKHKYNGRIKSIVVHDVLRDFGTSTDQQEIFRYHHELNPKYNRVIIYNKASLNLLLNFRKPATRSVLIPNSVDGAYSFENLKFLRVLDASDTALRGDARKSIHLRYLSIYSVDITFLKPVCKFQNVQTLIIRSEWNHECIVPLEIWKCPSLRHLILTSNHILEEPYEDGIYEETSLHTIGGVSNLVFTMKVLEMFMNLRKLRVFYNQRVLARESRNLVHMQKLENLSLNFARCTFTDLSDLAFPKTLKKLCLREIFGSWKDMSIVGSLPNLEVLILKWFEPKVGDGWEPIEGQFLKLKHLKLHYAALDFWEADSVHFPSLEILIFKEITDNNYYYKSKLKEIPSGIGEINTLRIIKLQNCSGSIVDSAKQIQADQWETGNQDLQLICGREEIRPEGY